MSFEKLTREARIKFNTLNDDAEETQARISVIQTRIAGMRDIASITPPLDLDRQQKRMADEQARFTSLMRVTTTLRTWIMQLPANIELANVMVIVNREYSPRMCAGLKCPRLECGFLVTNSPI